MKIIITETTVLPLLMACEGLLHYWKRTGPSHCQYDKLDDHMTKIRMALTLTK